MLEEPRVDHSEMPGEAGTQSSLLRHRPSQNVHYMSIPVNRASQASSPEDPGAFCDNARRQSILDHPIGSFRGVNSLGRFASSLRRANSFMNIEVNTDKERSFLKDGQDALYDPNTLAPSADGRRLSIALTSGRGVSVRPSVSDLTSGRFDGSAFADDQDSSSAVRSVISSDQLISRRPTLCFNDFNNAIDPDTESIMLKQVERKDGKIVTLLAGQSTGPQTIFNSVNVLIGIGLFALPLGMKYAGFVAGAILLFVFAGATFCSAELLSRCLDTDPTMISYGDLGAAAFGPKGRALVSFLFTLDLLGSGVALIIIFGDSLNALFPKYSVNFFKLVAFFAITPQAFMPLSVLSNVSLLGIASTLGTVFCIIFCGLYKSSSPGSLLNPASTSLWPENFKGFCLSIGLLSACWGGHAVFPNLKSDMRHPAKFKKCLVTTYSITATADIATAIVGFLMFGTDVKDEVTKSLLLTEGYPHYAYVAISALMALIPVAKAPLCARPIASVFNVLMGVSQEDTNVEGAKYHFKKIVCAFNALLVNVLFVAIGIKFPEFDKFIAFLGAGLCFAICLILPCLFYMKLCADSIKPWERKACIFTILLSTVFSILGVGAALVT